MYCPSCFNESLSISKKGVVYLFINNKHRDNGRFIYDLLEETPDVILEHFEEKVHEFFQWYSKFQNTTNIHSFELISASFICSHGCQIKKDQRVSVINILLPKEMLEDKLSEIAKKYKMTVNLEIAGD